MEATGVFLTRYHGFHHEVVVAKEKTGQCAIGAETSRIWYDNLLVVNGKPQFLRPAAREDAAAR